jgi:hypothetical protein
MRGGARAGLGSGVRGRFPSAGVRSGRGRGGGLEGVVSVKVSWHGGLGYAPGSSPSLRHSPCLAVGAGRWSRPFPWRSSGADVALVSCSLRGGWSVNRRGGDGGARTCGPCDVSRARCWPRGAGDGWEGWRELVVMVVGRKEQTWQRLHAVSEFGRDRPADPDGGIYLPKFPLQESPCGSVG